MQQYQLSLVDDSRIRRDPRKMAYLYPKMPVGRYKEAVDSFYQDITLKAIEDVAKIAGCHLIPASCIHHKNRRPDRRVRVMNRSYYVLRLSDLTLTERERYRSMCQEVIQ